MFHPFGASMRRQRAGAEDRDEQDERRERERVTREAPQRERPEPARAMRVVSELR